jgi:hypothetical protein
MRTRNDNQSEKLIEMQRVSKARAEWLMAELKRVRGLNDSDFLREALDYLRRKDIFHSIKKAVKEKSNTLEV